MHTHADFYYDERYHQGLQFLFNDLYSHQDFSERDRDLERIFPKLVKLLPGKVLETVSTLVELNLLTQQLDHTLAVQLQQIAPGQPISGQRYCAAYRTCNNLDMRQQQLDLIHAAGLKLERYARSQTILFALRMSEGAAEMAGLAALHGFIQRGFVAFHSMQDIALLMDTIVQREKQLLDAIYQGHSPNTFISFNAEIQHD